MEQLAVGRVRHGFRLHGGVDRHPLQMFVLTRAAALRRGQALGEQLLHALGADALAPTRHRRAVERQPVLEVRLAAEELCIGAVEIARTDHRVGKPIHMLQEMQPDHQPRRQTGAAEPLGVERTERRIEAPPIDQPRQPDQRMTEVDDALQPRAEQLGIVAPCGLLRAHRHRLVGDTTDRITPSRRPQPCFASFSPPSSSSLAKPNTSERRHRPGTLGLEPFLTSDEHYFGPFVNSRERA
jgi:hypothetical protein